MVDQAIAEVEASREHIADLTERLRIAEKQRAALEQRLTTEKEKSELWEVVSDLQKQNVETLKDALEVARAALARSEQRVRDLEAAEAAARKSAGRWKKVALAEAAVIVGRILIGL